MAKLDLLEVEIRDNVANFIEQAWHLRMSELDSRFKVDENKLASSLKNLVASCYKYAEEAGLRLDNYDDNV